MDAVAKARHIRQSARKVRQVLDEVRGTEVENALNKLHFSPKKASRVIEKTLRSAVANAINREGSEVDADKLFIKAKRALPAAEKAELAAKTKRDAAQPSLTAPTALVKTHTDAHNQTLQVLTNAENKATADCTQTSQSYNTWWQAVQSKRLPALQALAEAQLAWLQAEPDQRPALELKRTQAAQALARINEEIKRHRTQLDTHLQAGLNSDQAESAAQSRQAEAWLKLSAATQALAKVQDAFNLLDQDWMEKKALADQLRGEVNRSKRDSDMAKGQIGILEPSLQSTFRP